jgi:hypothetical protein
VDAGTTASLPWASLIPVFTSIAAGTSRIEPSGALVFNEQKSATRWVMVAVTV